MNCFGKARQRCVGIELLAWGSGASPRREVCQSPLSCFVNSFFVVMHLPYKTLTSLTSQSLRCPIRNEDVQYMADGTDLKKSSRIAKCTQTLKSCRAFVGDFQVFSVNTNKLEITTHICRDMKTGTSQDKAISSDVDVCQHEGNSRTHY